MDNLIIVLKMSAALLAAIMTGNWFLAEVRKSRLKGEPWYKPYSSLPGIIVILLIITLPLAVWIIKHH